MKRESPPPGNERPEKQQTFSSLLLDGAVVEVLAAEVLASPVLQQMSDEGPLTRLPFTSEAFEAWRRVKNSDERSLEEVCLAAEVCADSWLHLASLHGSQPSCCPHAAAQEHLESGS